MKQQLIKIRRDLHQIPEIEFDLPKTRSYIIQQLTLHNISYQIIADVGIVATIQNGEGKTLLIRGDMDALPMQEESGLSFSSQHSNAAHTCGHDIHTTMVLGAAIELNKRRNEFSGTIKFLFQPCEESIKGAKLMIEHHILDNVDACIAFHQLTTFFPSNTFASISGPVTSGSNIFRVDIIGKGGHASAPHLVIDPLKIGIELYQAFQKIIPNELNSHHSNVLAVSNFHSGFVHNVVPNSMFFEGNLRFFNLKDYNYLKNRMIEICDIFENLYHCEIKWQELAYCPPTINDKNLFNLFKKICVSEFIEMDQPFSFSEDFAFFSYEKPSLFIALNSGNIDEGYIYPLHHPKIIFNEDTIMTGVNQFIAFSLAFLNE